MALSLTTEEIAFVNDRRVEQNILPTYFNAALKSDIQISRDFETFLILAPNELKSSAISWIEKAVQLNNTNKLRDVLLARASSQEVSNAKLEITAFDATLKDFDNFRQHFATGSEFADVPEVQLFIQDLQHVIDELSIGRARSFHDQTVGMIVSRFDGGVGVSPEQVEELQSWTPVLSQYLSSSTPPATSGLSPTSLL